jgi:hypothetical protein
MVREFGQWLRTRSTTRPDRCVRPPTGGRDLVHRPSTALGGGRALQEVSITFNRVAATASVRPAAMSMTAWARVSVSSSTGAPRHLPRSVLYARIRTGDTQQSEKNPSWTSPTSASIASWAHSPRPSQGRTSSSRPVALPARHERPEDPSPCPNDKTHYDEDPVLHRSPPVVQRDAIF